METENKKYDSLQEFWPFYLSEHSNINNRRMHFIGSTFSLIFIIVTLITSNLYYLLAALLSGYGFAWIGHFLIQKNRPATFQYPLKSFISDWYMYFLILTFQIDKELKKYSIPNS